MGKPEKVIDAALQRIGCPYVYGGTGKPCTPAYRQARADQYPAYADKIRRNCPRMSGSATSCANCKWADPETGKGKLCYDCAQLALACMAAAEIPLVSGANSQWLKTQFTVKGEIDQLPRDRVALVFRRDDDGKMHHVGIYLGDGSVVHARGHDFGVVHQDLASVTFTHYGIPVGLYDNGYPTLRRGNRGEYVRIMQTALAASGEQLQIDGAFGRGTQDALKKYQTKNGLAADGVCGRLTWAALEKYIPAPDPAPDDPSVPEIDDDDDPVGVVVMSYQDAVRLRDYIRHALDMLDHAIQS